MELKAIWMDVNEYNMDYWGMIVDDKGTVIEGGIREAVWRGLVTEENCWYWWGLRKMANEEDGEWGFNDLSGGYSKSGVVYGRIVDGVAEPLEEGLNVYQG